MFLRSDSHCFPSKLSNLYRRCKISTRDVHIPFTWFHHFYHFAIFHICRLSLPTNTYLSELLKNELQPLCLEIRQRVSPKNTDVLLQKHNMLATVRNINIDTLLLCTILLHISLLGPGMFFIAGVAYTGQILPAACFHTKVFLEHSCAQSCMYGLRLFLCYSCRTE